MKPNIILAASLLAISSASAAAQGSPTAGGGTIVIGPSQSAPPPAKAPNANSSDKTGQPQKPTAPPATSAIPNTLPSDSGGMIDIRRN